MILPSTYVDPWKPNPFAPTSMTTAKGFGRGTIGTQLGSIWSDTTIPFATDSESDEVKAVGVSALFSSMASSATATNNTEVSGIPFGGLSLNDNTSYANDVTKGKKSSETKGTSKTNDDFNTVNDKEVSEVKEVPGDVDELVDATNLPDRKSSYHGGRTTRFGQRKPTGRFGSATAYRGSSSTYSKKSASHKPVTSVAESHNRNAGYNAKKGKIREKFEETPSTSNAGVKSNDAKSATDGNKSSSLHPETDAADIAQKLEAKLVSSNPASGSKSNDNLPVDNAKTEDTKNEGSAAPSSNMTPPALGYDKRRVGRHPKKFSGGPSNNGSTRTKFGARKPMNGNHPKTFGKKFGPPKGGKPTGVRDPKFSKEKSTPSTQSANAAAETS